MNLRSIDLNLLTVLEALFEEAHVTRAAERLGMSQPAVSNALERCRRLFDDPLLVRGAGNMQLTPKAQRLRAPLRRALGELAELVSPTQPSLGELHQTVRIAMPDFPANVVGAPIYRAVTESAPGIRLVFHPWLGGTSALDDLARGAVELVFTTMSCQGASIRKLTLIQGKYVVMMRRDHPAAADFTLEQWLAHPHVQISSSGDSDGVVDQALARIRRHRRIGIVVPNFQMVPPLLAESNLIALLPHRCVPPDDSRFVVFDPPLQLSENLEARLAWHARHDNDPGVQHVAKIVASAIKIGRGSMVLAPIEKPPEPA
jgi:DNA-binding transcriptional LysR family regulator